MTAGREGWDRLRHRLWQPPRGVMEDLRLSHHQRRRMRPAPGPVLVALATLVGCAGGIYGIGGGSILAPVLIGSGRRPAEVAPAALASTFVTSVAGVVTFTVLSLHQHGAVAGGYAGARLQSRLPETLIRRLIGILMIAIGARYL